MAFTNIPTSKVHSQKTRTPYAWQFKLPKMGNPHSSSFELKVIDLANCFERSTTYINDNEKLKSSARFECRAFGVEN